MPKKGKILFFNEDANIDYDFEVKQYFWTETIIWNDWSISDTEEWTKIMSITVNYNGEGYC